jgi:alpha-tubulin suppressor-like RCC1 family protein
LAVVALVGAALSVPTVLALTASPSPTGSGRASAATAAPALAPYALGDNGYGQLGDGADSTTPAYDPYNVPVVAPNGVRFTAFSAGAGHTVALSSTGDVYSWGLDTVGQLGDTVKTATPVITPQPVALPGFRFAAVAAGASHSLAMTALGQIYSWGSNTLGQLGDGGISTAVATPTEVVSPTNVNFTAIAAGAYDSLALSGQGAVYAWGANFYGQLGTGNYDGSDRPTRVVMPAGVTFTAIAAGNDFSLALTTKGTLYAWGNNQVGQLGAPAVVGSSSVPVPVVMPPGVTFSSIAAGAEYALALSTTGKVYAWGQDDNSQLAGPTANSGQPEPVGGLPALEPVVAVAANDATAYALMASGVVWDWGEDFFGQLGDDPNPNADPNLVPPNVTLPARLGHMPAGANVSAIFAGPSGSSTFFLTAADQTITVPVGPTVTFGALPIPVTATSALPVSVVAAGSCSYAGGKLFVQGVGSCTVTATQAGDTQFNPAPPVTVTFSISPAPLTLTALSTTSVTGYAPPYIHYTLSGFVNGNTAAVMSGAPVCGPTVTVTAQTPPGTYPVSCTAGTLSAANYVIAKIVPGTLTVQPPSVGYVVVGRDGSVWADGPKAGTPGVQPVVSYGSLAGRALNAPIVGAAEMPRNDGYWMVGSDGGIFSFGSAQFYGSMGGRPLNQPIVAMAATPDGKGYWLVAADGGIFAFGDAGYFGSTGGLVLNQPIVGMAATPDGQGYWLVAADGGMFAFGDAPYEGSASGSGSTSPFVGMAPTLDGNGYWLTTAAGNVYAYGDATAQGDLRYYLSLPGPIVGIAPASSRAGQGYWLVGADGSVYAFGSAAFYGAIANPPAPIAALISGGTPP